MDHGKIIAQGSPERLLKEHFNDVILEIPREDFNVDITDFPYTVLDTQNLIEISTSDVNNVIAILTNNKVPLNRLRIRPRNLEDLFLELTGKELRA